MGIGMKTRNDSSDKGTFNQEPKKRVNSQRKQDNTQKSSKQSPNQSLKQQQMQSRPRKRASDAQWHSVNSTERNSNRSKRVNPQYKIHSIKILNTQIHLMKKRKILHHKLVITINYIKGNTNSCRDCINYPRVWNFLSHESSEISEQ